MEPYHTLPIRAPLAYPLLALIAGLLLAHNMSVPPILPAASGLLLLDPLWQTGQHAGIPVSWSPRPCLLAYGEPLAQPARRRPIGLPPRKPPANRNPARVSERDRYGRGSGLATVLRAPRQSRSSAATPSIVACNCQAVPTVPCCAANHWNSPAS